jgi:3-oxoacyl-[acyl-carrier-protein] synthase II
MQMALKRAGISPADIDYVNAHGTSTPWRRDRAGRGGAPAGRCGVGKIVAMSSTKSSIGHLLGRAGSVEAIFCLLAMRDGIVPPTINLDNPTSPPRSTWCPTRRKSGRQHRHVEQSFGFGGTNAALIFAPASSTARR